MSLGGVLGNYLQTRMFSMKYHTTAENLTEINFFFNQSMLFFKQLADGSRIITIYGI